MLDFFNKGLFINYVILFGAFLDPLPLFVLFGVVASAGSECVAALASVAFGTREW
jgi:hypothetical protein